MSKTSSLFQIKRNQVQMMKDRGYDTSNEEGLFNITEEYFYEYYEQIANQYKQPLRSLLTTEYRKPDNNNSTLVYYAVPIGRDDQLNQETIAKFIDIVKNGRHDRAILISPVPLMSKPKASIKSIDQFVIEVFRDNELVSNKTKHVLVPKHEIIPLEQEAALLQELKATKQRLPTIGSSDPVVKYYGWEVDRIIKIYRRNIYLDTIAKSSVFYRVIVPTEMLG